MNIPRIEHIANFILELDKLKGVTRKSKPLGLDRYENSAEHSWQIAMLAWSLAPYAEEKVNIHRVIAMLLVHDIGEIDTGDIIVYAKEGQAEHKKAELKAIRRIFGLLAAPLSTELESLWLEFDEAETPDARFSHAADRAMPVLLNLANHGQSWRENGITHERVVRRIGPPIKTGCPAMWAYLEAQLTAANQKGWFGTQ